MEEDAVECGEHRKIVTWDCSTRVDFMSMICFCISTPVPTKVSDTAVTMALTNGTSTSRPSGVFIDSSSPAAVCSTSATVPTGRPSVVVTTSPWLSLSR